MLFALPHIAFRVPARWWAFVACSVLVLLAALTGSDRLRVLSYRASLDAALSPEPTGRTVPASWSFPFQSTRAMVDIEVDQAELAAARSIDTSRIFGSRGVLRERYIQSVVAEQAESAVVDRLVAEFRSIRDERGLDSDEYLELMTAAVQSIPYGDTEADTLLAPQVLAGSSGICTDKSLLLASLLVREGYDTVIWIFSTQKHVAVGVRSARAQFRGTGYAFIETTALRFVGQASQEYRALGPVADPPAQIALGGLRAYTSGGQVEVVLSELRRLQPLAREQLELATIARTTTRHRERYAERAMESWVADAYVRFIMTNVHDREGVYEVLAPPLAEGAPRLMLH